MTEEMLKEELDKNIMWLCEGFIALYTRGYFDESDAKQKEGMENWCKEFLRLYNKHRDSQPANENRADAEFREKVWKLVIAEIDGVFKAEEGLMAYVLYTLLDEKQKELLEIQSGNGKPIKYTL